MTLRSGVRALAGPLVLFVALLGDAAAQAQVADAYGPLVKWRQPSGTLVTPIHIGLLPDGDLFFVNAYNFFENPANGGELITTPGLEPEFLFVMRPTPLGSAPPESVLIQPIGNAPAMRREYNAQSNALSFKSLACSGHALLANGDLFFASGPHATVDLTLYNLGRLYDSLKVDGIGESVTYRPATGTWAPNPNMVVPGPFTHQALRWYATVTRMADTRMLVSGGYETVYPVERPNSSVEIFDPAYGIWGTVTAVEDTPAGIENPDYPHVFQFPDAGKADTVLVLGGSGEAMFLTVNPQGGKWSQTQRFRPDAKEYIDAALPVTVFPNHGSATALLPIRLPESSWGYSNGSIINVGGEEFTPMQGHIDVYDPGTNAWRPSIAMHGMRHDPSTVILPDGRILILAGYDDVNPGSTGYAEYVDPKNNFALSRGTAYMPETRAYHGLAALLPDGRVVVGGGNVNGADGTERQDFRYYAPDYMTKQRPQITQARDVVRIGDDFPIVVPHGTRVGEAALVGLASMTHAFDMNQRHVQLRVLDTAFTVRPGSAGWWTLVDPGQCQDAANPCYDLHVAQAPRSPALAPPGYYTLFILDEDRVPSIGKIVQLLPDAPRPPNTIKLHP